MTSPTRTPAARRAAADRSARVQDEQHGLAAAPARLNAALGLAIVAAIGAAIALPLGVLSGAPGPGFDSGPLLLALALLPVVLAAGLVAGDRPVMGARVLVGAALLAPGALANDLQLLLDSTRVARPELLMPTSLAKLAPHLGGWLLVASHVLVIVAGLAAAGFAGAAPDSAYAQSVDNPDRARSLATARRMLGLSLICGIAIAIGTLMPALYSHNAMLVAVDVVPNPWPVRVAGLLVAFVAPVALAWSAGTGNPDVHRGVALGVLSAVAAMSVPPLAAGAFMPEVGIAPGPILALLGAALAVTVSLLPVHDEATTPHDPDAPTESPARTNDHRAAAQPPSRPNDNPTGARPHQGDPTEAGARTDDHLTGARSHQGDLTEAGARLGERLGGAQPPHGDRGDSTEAGSRTAEGVGGAQPLHGDRDDSTEAGSRTAERVGGGAQPPRGDRDDSTEAGSRTAERLGGDGSPDQADDLIDGDLPPDRTGEHPVGDQPQPGDRTDNGRGDHGDSQGPGTKRRPSLAERRIAAVSAVVEYQAATGRGVAVGDMDHLDAGRRPRHEAEVTLRGNRLHQAAGLLGVLLGVGAVGSALMPIYTVSSLAFPATTVVGEPAKLGIAAGALVAVLGLVLVTGGRSVVRPAFVVALGALALPAAAALDDALDATKVRDSIQARSLPGAGEQVTFGGAFWLSVLLLVGAAVAAVLAALAGVAERDELDLTDRPDNGILWAPAGLAALAAVGAFGLPLVKAPHYPVPDFFSTFTLAASGQLLALLAVLVATLLAPLARPARAAALLLGAAGVLGVRLLQLPLGSSRIPDATVGNGWWLALLAAGLLLVGAVVAGTARTGRR